MRSRRRPLLVLLALLLLTAAGYVAFWFSAASRVKDGLAAWSAARKAEGYRVDYGAPRISGFPLVLRLRLERPSLASPDGRWRWSGDGAEATARPWSLREFVLHPIGRQELGMPAGAGSTTVAASAAAATLALGVDPAGHFEAGRLEAQGLVLELPKAAGQVGVDRAHLELAMAPAEGHGGAAPAQGPSLPATLSFRLRLERVTLPPASAGPLGPELRLIVAQGDVLGAVPPGKPAQALAAWRDAGGTLELKNFDLAWGPLQLSGSATLALDPAMQPEGAGTARIRGYNETVDALVAQGLVQPRNGLLAKAGLGLLAKPADDGNGKVLTAPLGIQRQRLFAGPIPLLRLPTIAWAE